MTRRQLLMRFGFVAAAGAATFAAWLWWSRPTHNITVAAVELLQEGMTLEQVVELFGVPPGTYRVDGESRDHRDRDSFWFSLLGKDYVKQFGDPRQHTWVTNDLA